MIGQIQQARMSQSGKNVSLQVNGQWYTSKNKEFLHMVGHEITFDPAPQTFPDGGVCNWINEYSDAAVATTPASQAMDAAMANQPPPEPVPQTPDVPRGTTGRDPTTYLPMTSNIVAHAIQAGLIKEPRDLEKWATAAMSAAKSAVELPY